MKSLSKMFIVALISLLLLTLFSALSGVALAATRGAITISFDDGLQTQYTYALPLLQARGMPGVFYIITSKVGTPSYLSVAQLQAMQNSGSEIDSHSVTHPDFTTISYSQIQQECSVSQSALRSWGLSANNFAYPNAARNTYTDSIVTQYYRTPRWGYVGPYVVSYPTSQSLLPAMDGSVSYSADTSFVDQIYSANGWGIIVFHDVSPSPAGISQNHIDTNSFASFLDYVRAKGVAVITIDQALNSVAPPPPSPPSGGSTFGTTSVGGLSTTLYTVVPRATQYTPASSGTVTDIMLYLTVTGSGGRAQVAIYSDNAGTPGTLLAKSSSDTITTNGWHDFSGFNVAVTAGTPYWLASETDSGNLLWYYNNGGPNYTQGSSGSYGTFPSPYIRGNTGNYQTSIYAIYS
jgi:peptidoglycan/xylan/chitin deacetylase (PgdA/CDA1 family)